MASVLDQPIAIAPEATYNTPATTGFKGFEVTEDSVTIDPLFIDSDGRRQGRETGRSDRSRTIIKGGTLSMPHSVLTRGEEVILYDFFGAREDPAAAVGTTNPALHRKQYHTDPEGPSQSFTVAITRTRKPDSGNALEEEHNFYTGCVITGGEISVARDEVLMIKPNFIWSKISATGTGRASPTPTYAPVSTTGDAQPAKPFYFDDCNLYTGAAITGGTPLTAGAAGTAATSINTPVRGLTSFNLTLAHTQEEDLRFIDGESNRQFPNRMGAPVYTGTLEIFYYEQTSQDFYTKFQQGALAPLRFVAGINSKYASPQGDNLYLLEIVIPQVRFEGPSPVSSYESLTKATVPFTVKHDGVNHAITCNYVNTETDLR